MFLTMKSLTVSPRWRQCSVSLSVQSPSCCWNILSCPPLSSPSSRAPLSRWRPTRGDLRLRKRSSKRISKSFLSNRIEVDDQKSTCSVECCSQCGSRGIYFFRKEFRVENPGERSYTWKGRSDEREKNTKYIIFRSSSLMPRPISKLAMKHKVATIGR